LFLSARRSQRFGADEARVLEDLAAHATSNESRTLVVFIDAELTGRVTLADDSQLRVGGRPAKDLFLLRAAELFSKKGQKVHLFALPPSSQVGRTRRMLLACKGLRAREAQRLDAVHVSRDLVPLTLAAEAFRSRGFSLQAE